MGTTNNAAIDIRSKSAAHRDPQALLTWLYGEATAFFLTCDSSDDVSLAEFREWADVPESMTDAYVLSVVMAARAAMPPKCPACDEDGYRDDDAKCDRRLCCDGTLDYPRVSA